MYTILQKGKKWNNALSLNDTKAIHDTLTVADRSSQKSFNPLL